MDVNPYEVPDKIWSLIEPYFSKYGVDVRENHPTDEVSKPVIVWTTVKRTPGREGSKIHGKGSNFAKFLKVTPDGYVHELHIQQQIILLEYTIYAPSTALVKRIAWDLERAVLETVGVMQGEIEGFQMFFQQQTPDSSLYMRQQDEIIKRAIRFEILLPVKFTKLVPELRFIELVGSWGRLQESEELSRDSSDTNFYIPVNTGQKVISIVHVYVKSNGSWEMLEKDTDFKIKRDSDQLLYIEWNDDYGRVPQVGDDFMVDYEIAHYVRSSNIKPQ